MARSEDTKRVDPNVARKLDDKRKPDPRNEKTAGQPEPLDEESLERVMRETPL